MKSYVIQLLIQKSSYNVIGLLHNSHNSYFLFLKFNTYMCLMPSGNTFWLENSTHLFWNNFCDFLKVASPVLSKVSLDVHKVAGLNRGIQGYQASKLRILWIFNISVSGLYLKWVNRKKYLIPGTINSSNISRCFILDLTSFILNSDHTLVYSAR